jgi:polyisoprenoid-binding protein YceI
VDAVSGRSGNSSRDGRMHKEILESARYPEITFHPSRVEGKVASQGKSSIQVHGVFGVHGAAHEITIPVQVEMAPDRWTANAHFAIPYVEWRMKNPSTFVLRVNQTVEIDVHATGPIPPATQ